MIERNERILNTQISLDINRNYNKKPIVDAPTTNEGFMSSYGDLGGSATTSNINQYAQEQISDNIYDKSLNITKQSILSYMKRLVEYDKLSYEINPNNYKTISVMISENINNFIYSLNYTNLCNMSEIKSIIIFLSNAQNIEISNFIFHLTRRLISTLNPLEIDELTDSIFSSLTFYSPKQNANELQIKTWSTTHGVDENVFKMYPWLIIFVLLIDIPFTVSLDENRGKLMSHINIG